MTEWIECTLDKLGEIVGGATPSTKCEDYYGGSIPWITPKDLSSFKGRYITSGERNITEKGLASCSAQMMPKDAVLFTSRAPIGYVAIASQSVCTNQGFKSIVVNEKADPLFVYYLLKYNKDAIEAMGSGTTFKEVSGKTMRAVKVRIPLDVSYQKRIAAVLDSLDTKIENNERINDNLQQQAAALFESWFVNYDPWDGVQPSEWENAPLGSFVEIKRGGSPRPIQDFLSDSGLRWLKISDVTSLSSPFVLEIKEHIKEEGLRKTVFLHAGELVLSNSATPGIPKILDVDTCIHDGWLYFPKSELSKYYLYLFFKHIRKELVALGNGSVFTNLKTDILKAFPATKADESTLKEFDALVTPLFDAMLNADRENFKLAAMRDALLPKLMSGEIDVSAIQL